MKHARNLFANTVEGINRGTNTSPIPDPEEQEKQNTSPNTGPQARIISVETQEETSQPESLEMQDTGITQTNTMLNHDSDLSQAKDTGEAELSDAQDRSNTQYKTVTQIHSSTMKNMIPIYQMNKHLEYLRKTIITLPLMRMKKMTQYNLSIQLLNHSCQGTSEYPLQR